MTTFGETTIYDVREVADEPSTITAVEAPAPVDIVATPAAPDPGMTVAAVKQPAGDRS